MPFSRVRLIDSQDTAEFYALDDILRRSLVIWQNVTDLHGPGPRARLS